MARKITFQIKLPHDNWNVRRQLLIAAIPTATQPKMIAIPQGLMGYVIPVMMYLEELG
ncbi:hypothetical protein KIN20_009567 [Parelaphostrongylus tenuis]|uniref:Uncharacterized protein n=1 Tax=Parelaphostrongylus tenuis TaxID=148309 RepID=A0AAD5M6K0_PARTN|nr:hypothetical protein KIN20_009567 [Parelaphostrongylus tenuis]